MVKRKILFLISDTGGGHRANANAVKDAFTAIYPDMYEFEIIDVLVDYSFWPMSRAPKIYSILSTKYPFIWKLLFSTQHAQGLTRLLSSIIAKNTYKKLYSKISSYGPDLIISIHPLVQELSFECLKHLNKKIPYTVICTDLSTAHHLWFNKNTDTMFVVCGESIKTAVNIGIAPSNIFNYGLPVRAQFSKKYANKKVIRKKLGINENLPVALVFGGGDGVGPIVSITASLVNKLNVNGTALGQVVVLCGRNVNLKNELESKKWAVPTKFFNFVENVAEIMSACDVLITKAGPGSIAEGLICGLPIIIYGFIPGQEEGNIPFVTNAKAGFYIKNPSKISQKVVELFTNERVLKNVSGNAKKLSTPNSTKDIVTTLHELYFKS